MLFQEVQKWTIEKIINYIMVKQIEMFNHKEDPGRCARIQDIIDVCERELAKRGVL